MNSALQIGRSAITGYQSALQVIGSNISSVGSSDYTRLDPQLDPMQGPVVAGGLQPGSGVALTGIQRNIDESLEARLRMAIGDEESLVARQDALAQVEVLFDDTSEASVSARLTTFFQSFDELQNTPEDQAIRDLAITNGVLLTESIQGLCSRLAELGEDIDDHIAELVTEAQRLAEDIAGLNAEISRAEAGVDGQATGLRDQRDARLRELSEVFDVTVREQTDGTLNVYVGSEALVQGSYSRGLVAVQESDGSVTRTGVRFADTNAEVDAGSGRLEGLATSRDEHVYARISTVDELASAIIAEVNRMHADGQGQVAFQSVTGSYAVMSTEEPLDSAAAGLAFPPQNGSFYITVADDATGTPAAHRIDVDPSGSEEPTTLASLAADITAQVEGVTAAITADNRLSLTADAGYSFTFGHDGQQAREDTSGVLAALGINTLFTGHDARDMAVSDEVLNEPSLLSASSVFMTGDGTVARQIAAIATTPTERLGGVSITAFSNALADSVAITSSGVNEATEAASAVKLSLQTQKESISGVNLDEEAISLLTYERAFQGASRFVTVVDQLLDELIHIVR